MGFLKTLRVLRALRPLRVISRNPNLKLVVNTLFQSVPELCNLLVVAGLFFLIFGLFSVAYFQGGFFTCQVVDGGDLSEAAAGENMAMGLPFMTSVMWEAYAASRADATSYSFSGVPNWLCVDANSESQSFGAAWALPAAEVHAD